jgi:hypothetical protein
MFSLWASFAGGRHSLCALGSCWCVGCPLLLGVLAALVVDPPGPTPPPPRARALCAPTAASVHDVLAMLEHGGRRNIVAVTALNRDSSRSHTMFTISVERRVRGRVSAVQRHARMRNVLVCVQLCVTLGTRASTREAGAAPCGLVWALSAALLLFLR